MNTFTAEFQEAWGRQSVLMLDSLGIYVDTGKLPCVERLRAARRRQYGTNYISRWWCLKIRPRLFPKIQREIDSTARTLQEQLWLEFDNEVMNQAKAAGCI